MEKKILVAGATGRQAKGLLTKLVADKSNFTVRAITRNPESDKARELSKSGVEVIRADYDEPETLTNALEGCYGAFLVTNYWEHFDAERELLQAKNFAEACKKKKVQHVVWSTLDDAQNLVQERDMKRIGKYYVPLFEGKARADAVFKELGVPTTFLLTSCYYETFSDYLTPRKGENGVYIMDGMVPAEVQVPLIAAEDIGKAAYTVLKNNMFVGEYIGVVAEWLTFPQIARHFTQAFEQNFQVRYVPYEEAWSLEIPQAQAIANLWRFMDRYHEHMAKTRSQTMTKQIVDDLLDFRSWLYASKEKFEFSTSGL